MAQMTIKLANDDMHLPEFTEVSTLGFARRQGDGRSATKTLTTDQADHGTPRECGPKLGHRLALEVTVNVTVRTRYPSPAVTEDSDIGYNKPLECGPRHLSDKT